SPAFEFLFHQRNESNIVPFTRVDVNTGSILCVLDRGWSTYDNVIISRVQLSVENKVISFDAYPNFIVFIIDPYINEILQLNIRT
ncbi:unnamed protein product, partial [Dovyalis caffra]